MLSVSPTVDNSIFATTKDGSTKGYVSKLSISTPTLLAYFLEFYHSQLMAVSPLPWFCHPSLLHCPHCLEHHHQWFSLFFIYHWCLFPIIGSIFCLDSPCLGLTSGEMFLVPTWICMGFILGPISLAAEPLPWSSLFGESCNLRLDLHWGSMALMDWLHHYYVKSASCSRIYNS